MGCYKTPIIDNPVIFWRSRSSYVNARYSHSMVIDYHELANEITHHSVVTSSWKHNDFVESLKNILQHCCVVAYRREKGKTSADLRQSGGWLQAVSWLELWLRESDQRLHLHLGRIFYSFLRSCSRVSVLIISVLPDTLH